MSQENKEQEEVNMTSSTEGENSQQETTNSTPESNEVEQTENLETQSSEAESIQEEAQTTVSEIEETTVEQNNLVVETEKAESTSTEAETENSQDSSTEETEAEEVDYENYSKEQLLEVTETLMTEENIRKITNTLRTIKPIFNKIVKEERDKAKEQFVAEGGDEGDFKYRQDKTTTVFYQNVKKINDKKAQKIAQIEKERQKNLETKTALLEKLREIVDAEESELSITEFKKIQEEWKNTGPAQPQQNRTLWANYNALLDRFYDKRSIYFELKELDRKKNLELKIALCERAENLINTTDKISTAIQELSNLHDEFKHIGPVPQEQKDSIWERFKGASDKLYDKKRELMAEREQEREENLVKKLAIIEKVLPYQEFDSNKITDWNTKTKELIEIQKEWETIRFIPRNKIKEVSNQFWAPFKTFFNNKQNFFKKLDEERMGNLEQKEALIKQAEEAIANTEEKDSKNVADTLKQLQRDWKNIGPVPIKFKNSVYDKFKAICDGFFESKRKAYNNQEKEYQENLDKKKVLIEEIKSFALNADTNLEVVLTFLPKWKEIGFVPRKDKNSIQKDFENSLYDMIEKLPEKTDVEKAEIRLGLQMEIAKDSPFASRKLQQREFTLRNKINQLEDDIANLNNNLGFFSNSKKANSLKEQVESQIAEAEKNLKSFKIQLKVLRDNRKKQEQENKDKENNKDN